MTAKELQLKSMALQQECNAKQMELRKQYAIEHNPVKVGDIVTDHYHTIRVEKMSACGYPIPSMRYIGTELTKQGAALDCYYRLREDRNNTNRQEDLDKARNWLYNRLKSLRERYTWKPSDEQMKALNWALSLANNCGEECSFDLRTLYEQLKKLKG